MTSNADQTTTRLSRADLEETANYGPYDVAKLHNVYGEGVCLHCDYIEPAHATDCSWRLATDALAYMTALEQAKDVDRIIRVIEGHLDRGTVPSLYIYQELSRAWQGVREVLP